ncbi:carbohydrate ABC transporter permease [Paenibacillus solisilvae]|uniref:Carbohydrate ABC transporter permease n=1 Tax=Paenibacillus solisilvae TaxID=2486751 RepID=A0ABW0VS33_9BACL
MRADNLNVQLVKRSFIVGIAKSWKKNYMAAIVLIPVTLHFLIFSLFPVIFGLFTSFTNFSFSNLANGKWRFIGISNWKDVLSDDNFWHSLWVTLKYTLYYVPTVMVLGLFFAYILNRDMKGMRFFRSVFFLPTITSGIVLAAVWKYLFAGDEGGVFNSLMSIIGLDPIQFWGDGTMVLPIIASLGVYMGAGSLMVYFLGGIKGIPTSIHESALIDGAGKWRMFYKITLPLLKPTVLYALILSTIASFQVFDVINILTLGGPAGESTTIAYLIYNNGFKLGQLGYASAVSYILFIIVGIVTFIQFKWLGAGVSYE